MFHKKQGNLEDLRTAVVVLHIYIYIYVSYETLQLHFVVLHMELSKIYLCEEMLIDHPIFHF